MQYEDTFGLCQVECLVGVCGGWSRICVSCMGSDNGSAASERQTVIGFRQPVIQLLGKLRAVIAVPRPSVVSLAQSHDE